VYHLFGAEVRRRWAFSLIELLVVVALVAMLSALLLPVFASVKASSQRAACASRFHQAQLAAMMYVGDWDDTFPLVSYVPGASGGTEADRTWVQCLFPYGFAVPQWRCPSAPPSSGDASPSFDPDLSLGDVSARYYAESFRAHIGLNYLYLSPVVALGEAWVPQPRSLSMVASPSSMLLFVDSASPDQRPPTSGSWVVVPPCRYAVRRTQVLDTFLLGGRPVFTPVAGWLPKETSSGPWYGGASPWHAGRAMTVAVDGSARARTMAELASGCDVRPNWSGFVRRDGLYPWDLE